ncbi:MAG: hypothetical protein MUC69_05955 [Gemmatimonadales bacterium]|jgi:hypothetical protein|nr:hypothetical protein [Gemmatimonadales bacterium]
MTHLTIADLISIDEPGLEPGAARARAHLAGCDACRAAYEAHRQRVARLRALPALRPASDQWPAVGARLAVERRRQAVRRAMAGAVAIAAGLLLAVGVWRAPARDAQALAAEAELVELRERSRALEAAIEAYAPERRVVDGRTVRVASDLEARIADLDQRMQYHELDTRPGRGDAQLMQMWQERVGLLNALVDVHVTSASNVGL